MRYRRLDANYDMTFGQGQSNFLIDQPEAVAQLVLTRLMLAQGEWFADTSDGTPWATQVLGERTQATRDVVVRNRVQTTLGVLGIDAYYAIMDPNLRAWSATMTIDTVYGAAVVTLPTLPTTLPPLPPPPAPVPSAATALGIQGGTPLSMTEADLTQGLRSDITELEITTVAAGSW